MKPSKRKDKSRDTSQLTKLVAKDCFAVRIRKLNRGVSRIYDDKLRQHDLKTSQLAILVHVNNLGNPRPQELSESLMLEKSTVSRTLERLIDRGLLEAEYTAGSKIKAIKLSDSGNKLFLDIYPSWIKAQEILEAMLGKGFIQVLDQALEEFADG